ncbi:MAG: hypothetical protein RRZ63_01680 [Clostridium sp.]
MKKVRRILLAAAVLSVLLSGCASQKNAAFTPAKSCVYVAQDGSVSSALVKKYEGEAVDEKDLKQYLEAAVIRYNKENGGQEKTENSSDASQKLPVALQSAAAKKGVLTAIFNYASVEDLVKFRQTIDNEDMSNTITAIEVKKDAENYEVSIEGGGTVMFPGKIISVTDGAVKEDEYTVTLPNDGKSSVVFK